MLLDEAETGSATALAGLVARRAISPVEIVEATLARIERYEPRLSMFTLVMADSARDAARRAEDAVMSGEPLGPLHGVPITIKDNVAIGGLPTGNGSLAASAAPAREDTATVARIRSAGAIIIGKTALPEFAHKVLTDSLAHGTTRNPWNLDHTPGGSSGGASAALAVGIAPLAVGTDGGGSIRCPAACTGVLGLKATLGRIPNEPMPDGFGNFAFVGPMARSVQDLALLLRVMQGALAADPFSIAADAMVPAAKPVRGLRVAWMQDFGLYRAEPETAALTAEAVRLLEEAGAIVEQVCPPCFDDLFPTYQVLATTAHASRLGALFDAAGDRMTDSLRDSIAIGRRWSAVDLQQAQDRRTTLFRSIQRLFKRHDLICTPTMLAPPPLVDAGGSIATDAYAEWAAALYPFNMSGHPAASVPAGFTRAGLPVGLQLVGPWFGESQILQAASHLQEAIGGFAYPPTVG